MSKVITATGQAPADVTQYGIWIGAGAGQATMNTTLVLTDGQMIMGNTGIAPTAGVLEAGTGIDVSYAGGNWVISATGAGITPVHQTGTTITLVAANMYIMDAASLITATLPATAAIGDTFIIVGSGAGGWKVNVASTQSIQVSSTATTVSTGSIASTNRYDCTTLVCVTANTLFVAYGTSGGLTVA